MDHLDIGSVDACRISGRITHGDDGETEQRLVGALQALVAAAPSIERPPAVHLPEPRALELEQVMRPREAFFARVEQVPIAEAVGRVVAELVSPYPPGVPVLAPGERVTQEAVDYLTTGVQAGMLIPDAADSSMETLRVVAG
jgi:arginine decarboxylase